MNVNITGNFQFEKEFEILSFQIDPHGSLRWSSLADLLQEVAWKHADSRDFGKQLFDKGFMWVLSRFHIKVFEMPTWGQQIKIKTAGRGINKLFALREFEVISESGQVIAKAMSAWLLLDIKSKRPQRPRQVLPSELFDDNPDENLLPNKINLDVETTIGKSFSVNYSDLDMNNHVNNVSYIRWIEDFCFEKGIYLDEMLINYIAEALIGEEIEIYFNQGEKETILSGQCNHGQIFLAKIKQK
ncbi:acyl-[acyl-carrier-protein] thioesterase [Shivajiella indica]|uniref:Acyl-[acyl-carrier-protein] thioesterase n=1 Tax=Shivajiella indica TaxID=872115 RepID=A0ABW5BC23_9BACT